MTTGASDVRNIRLIPGPARLCLQSPPVMRHPLRFTAALGIAGTVLAMLLGAEPEGPGTAKMKTETFDRDPGWDRANNRPADRRDQPVTIRQDFGFSPTAHAGGKAGEIGGFVQAAAEPAFYALALPDHTFEQPLSASGTLAVADGGTHLLLGFFNA